ncbi:hypothetical protein BD410DRAFT_785145 [Rickenella mellea]|uniref:F-box domain-containing protein n=1 Tax=Rickenella mellea TaxID=50990 RepID=A0A4Y7QDC7_9AGAM|nr:hypothetical protein BD410DRAFT_785145 [Rickenella mellea]
MACRKLVTESRLSSAGSTTHRHGSNPPPIKNLSFELLSKIFLECLPETGFPTPSTKVAPMLLSRICSHWRFVAMRTPQLWAGIDLDDHWEEDALHTSCPTHDYLKDAMAAEEWSTRAGLCLLSYRLWYTNPHFTIGMQNVLKVILSHHGRWRHITCYLPPSAWIEVFYADVWSDAPHLQYLKIVGADSVGSAGVIEVPNPGSPKIHSLFLNQCDLWLAFADTGAPLLRKVVVDNNSELTLDDCWSFLRHCPNLEVFAAYCESREPLTPTSPTTHGKILEAGCLKKLHLEVKFADSSQLLDRFHAPALETLELADYHTGGGPGPPSGYPQLARFLSKSNARLTSMNIDLDMTDDEFLDSFYHTPALTSLELHNQWRFLSTDVMDSLIMRPMYPQKHVLPSLEHIAFTGVDPWMYESIEKIVQSRWGGSAGAGLSTTMGDEMSGGWERRLRSVHLHGSDSELPSRVALRPMIMACIEEGLEVIEEPRRQSPFSAYLFSARL